MQSTGPGGGALPSNAGLSLDIDHSKVDSATKALSEFDRQNKQTGGSTQQLLDQMSKLTKEMEQVVQAQRQTNELIAQGTRAQRDAAQTIEASMSSWVRWSAAIATGSAAWNYFTKDVHSGAQNVQTQVQTLTGSIETLNAKMAEMRTGFSGTLGNYAQYVPGLSAIQSPIFNPLGVGQGIDPFGIASFRARMDELQEQLGTVLTQTVARTTVPGENLISGIGYGQRIGLNENASVNALARMQSILNGVSLEAVRARQTMGTLGISTDTNAEAALKATLDRLSQMPVGPERNALLQRLLPGSDPALLVRSNIQAGMPQGPGGRYYKERGDLAEGFAAERAELQEERRRIETDPNGLNFWGRPRNNITGMGRYFARFGEYFESGSAFDQATSAITERQETNRARLGASEIGLLEAYGNAAGNWLDRLRAYANPLFGGAFGEVMPDRRGGQDFGGGGLDPRVSEAYRDEVEAFMARAGRASPTGAQLRLDRQRMQGQALVDKGAMTQEDFDAAMRLEQARYNRIVNPYDELFRGMEANNAILALPPEMRGEERVRRNIREMRRQRGEDELIDTEFGPLPSPEENRAAGYHRTQQSRERADTANRLANSIDRLAEIANAPLADQGRLKAELAYRNQLFPEYQGAPPALDADQQARFEAGYNKERTASGETLMKQTDQTIENNKKLADAYKEGLGAVERVKAATQAHTEVLQGQISAQQEAARTTQLLTQGFANAQVEIERMLDAGRGRVTSAGRIAGAAASGPIAVTDAEIVARVDERFREPLAKATTDEERATIEKQKAEALQQERQIQQETYRRNRETQQRERDLQRGDFGRATGTGAYGVPGATMNYGNTGALGSQPQAASQLVTVRSASGASFRVNADAAPYFQGFVDDLEGTGYRINPGESYGYSNRDKAGGTGKSEHAFGTAIDINPTANPFMTRRTNLPADTQAMAAKWGLVWGMQWPTKPDPMHFQWGGPGSGTVGQLAPWPVDQTQAAQGGGGMRGNIQLGQYAGQARRNLEAQGINAPAGSAAMTQEQREIAAGYARSGLESLNERIRTNEELIRLENERAAAIAKGTAEEQKVSDAISVEMQTRKVAADAMASGDKQVIDALAQFKAGLLSSTSALTQARNVQGIARFEKQFADDQASLGRETRALETGGIAAYEVQQKAEGYAARYRSYGMPDDEAMQKAQGMAQAAQHAEDYVKALKDASAELKSGIKSGIDTLVDGMADSVGKGKSLRDTVNSIGLSLSKIGLDMFVKKPLNRLADNFLEGRGFSFNVGSSGMTDAEASGKVLGGAFRGAGGGGGGIFGQLFGWGGGGGSSGYSGGGPSGSFDTAGQSYSSFSDFGMGDFGGGWAHQGALLGFNVQSSPRTTVPDIWRSAPRMHRGGLMPDEVPIIGQKGERVLNREETKAYDRGGGGRGGTTVHAPITIVTQDADSFRRNEKQVAGMQQRTLDRAARNF